MPAATLNVNESNSAVLPSVANIVAKFGVCRLGVVNQVYEFDSDTAVEGVLGDGQLTESVAASIRISKRRCVAVPVPVSTAGIIGAVTETPAGTGPLITVAGTPYDTLDYGVKITVGGDNGVGKFRLAQDYFVQNGVDKSTYGSELEIPAQTKATFLSVDLTAVTPSSFNTKTLILDGDVGAQFTTTFAAVTTLADLATQINAAAATASAGVTASLTSANKIKIVSNTAGSASTLLNGNGTSNADFGFTNGQTAAGLNAVYTIPGTGLTLTFPNGTYVGPAAGVFTVYTFSTRGPRCSLAELNTAIDALKNSGVKFGRIHVTFEAVDATDCAAMAASVDSKVQSLLSSDKIFAPAIIGAPVAETDIPLKDAFLSFVSAKGLLTVAARDAYVRGGTKAGSFRRSASWQLAARAAKVRVSSDPGNGQDGPLEEVTRLGGNELTATTKLRGFRFTVLETRQEKTGFFVSRGVTMALATSNFRDFNLVGVMGVAFKQAQSDLTDEVNNDPVIQSSGKIAEHEATAIEGRMQGNLEALLKPAGETPHVSAVKVVVNRDNILGTTRNLIVDFELLPKGQNEFVTGNIGYASGLAVEG